MKTLTPRQALYLRIVTDHPGIDSRKLWERAHNSDEYGNHGVPANSVMECLDRLVTRGKVRKVKPHGNHGRGRGSVIWFPVEEAKL